MQPEVLITKPIQLDGDTLQFNVDAIRGMVRVGIDSADPAPNYNGSTPSTATHLKVTNNT
ncbi:MAG: hypothetical protein EXR62_08745 [Chloroflexi bacterium]|nr:hypothetical protein [Chloroflexota bacterium]